MTINGLVQDSIAATVANYRKYINIKLNIFKPLKPLNPINIWIELNSNVGTTHL
jgi:hypothetical protein